MLFLPPPPACCRASAAPRRILAVVRTLSTAAPLPRRPFPWPLHVGTDICRISRVHAILTSSSSSAPPATPHAARAARAARFIRRLLSPHEVAALVASAPSSSASLASSPLAQRASTPQVLAWLLAGGQPADPSSLASYSAHRPPNDSRFQKAAEFLAGRFAAKEAAIKAHPHLPHKLTFHQIRIVRRHTDTNSSGPPVALVRVGMDPSQDAPCEQEALLSISHDGDYATAVCLGFDGSNSLSPPAWPQSP